MGKSKKEKGMLELKSTIMPYDVVTTYQTTISKFVKRLLKSSEPDQELTDQLRSDIWDLLYMIQSKRNRIKVLYISLIAERHWLDENGMRDYKENNSIWVMSNIIRNSYTDIDKEASLLYALYKTLEENPINTDAKVYKAILYTMKIKKQRFFGKENPVDYLIRDYIRYTPLLGYSTYLAKKDINLWRGMQEFLPKLRFFTSDPVNPDFEKDEDEKIHERLYPVISYVYVNNKLNHVENRRKFLGYTEENLRKKKEEKERVEQDKIRKIIHDHMQSIIYYHNDWYVGTSSPPINFDKFVQENDIGNTYIILCVGRSGSTKYKEGYLSSDSRMVITKNFGKVLSYKTEQDAKNAIKECKDKGIIFDGTAMLI